MALTDAVVSIEHSTHAGPFVIVCEHASNRFLAEYGTLGLSDTQTRAHIAWDPGALGLARGLLGHLGGVLVAGGVSRLIYDCNRPPDAPGAMPANSEMHDIPGNAVLDASERLARTRAIYVPFSEALHGVIAERLATGPRPVLVTVHSFTPTWFGTPRDVEFGAIHDADPGLARRVVSGAAGTGLRTELNAPYSAADGVTHTLRLHATPYGLDNVMLEIRNDLIATPQDQVAMAARLAPVLSAASAPARIERSAG